MKYLKILFNKVVMRKRLSLNELKVKLSTRVDKIVKDIDERKVREKDFEELLEMLTSRGNLSKEEVQRWTEKVTFSLTPECVKDIDEALYDLRWDVVFLDKEDYFSFPRKSKV